MSDEWEPARHVPAGVPVHRLALCEAGRLVLFPGHLYTFEQVPGCQRCEELAACAEEPPDAA